MITLSIRDFELKSRKISGFILLIISLNSNAIMHYTGMYNLPIIAFVVVIVLSILLILCLNRNKINDTNSFLPVCGIVTASLLFAVLWDSYKNITICVGPVAAYLIFIFLSYSEIKKITFVFLIINFIIAFFEYTNNTYLYNYTTNTYGIDVTIEAYSDYMRAKGLFASCLGLGYFGMFASFIFRKDLRFVLLGCLLCLLSVSRQPLIITTSLFLFFFKFNTKNIFVAFFIILILITIVVPVLDERIFTRILSAIDFEGDTSNLARIEFWVLGINTFLYEYDFVHKIVGNMGFFQNKVGYNAESAWITLFLDMGIIGVLIHLSVLIKLLFYSFRKKDWFFSIMILFIIIAMATVPLIHNLNQNIYFWLFIFVSYREQKKYFNTNDIKNEEYYWVKTL
jgi:hypothetical protein